jgi:hypothetical protein
LGSLRSLGAILEIAFLSATVFLPPLAAPNAAEANASSLVSFEVRFSQSFTSIPDTGRLFVILSRTGSREPRLGLGRTGRGAPQAFARDLDGVRPASIVVIDRTAFGFPRTNLLELPAGDYSLQALFAANTDLNFPNAPENLCTEPQPLHLDPATQGRIHLELTRKIPPDELPPETAQIRFVKVQSRLLTEFHHRPIYLRAGIILPPDYDRESSRRYPLWVRIGGLNTRYTVVSRLMAKDSDFRKTWQADTTPRFILLQLDGAGPYGDPYYVNSANNGPYGDALVRELIPLVEARFRATGKPSARVLSGVSTGGWVALALQIFYPNDFNGTWSACPDPVDFRALELLNIYEDTNAYVTGSGEERPSERAVNGSVVLTMRQEVGAENLLGRGDSYTRSGEQWGAWNAVFSPRGADGFPLPLWDPQTGRIDHRVADQWRKYDLRAFLQDNWRELGPRLNGKLHISAGEADQYYLNHAVHLLDQFLSKADPPFQGSIVYGARKPHGWSNENQGEMLKEMEAATQK